MYEFSGNRFREARKSIGLTLAGLGESLGITNSYISQFETGKKVPSDTIIRLFCSTYSVNFDWLMTGEGPMFILEDIPDPEITESEKLREVIIRVRRWENEHEQDFEPEDLAETIIKIYKFYIDGDEEVNDRSFLRVVELIS